MAFPTTRDELNQVISEQIRASFSEKKIADIDKLEAFFPVWDRLYSGYTEFTIEFSNLKSELEVLRAKLNEAMPQLQEGVRKGLGDLEARAEAANVRVATSVTGLEKRDREISEKLKESFHSIDSQIESVSLQAATVKSMQSGVHGTWRMLWPPSRLPRSPTRVTLTSRAKRRLMVRPASEKRRS